MAIRRFKSGATRRPKAGVLDAIVVGASNVVTGNKTWEPNGAAGNYPTTATSQASQLATDQGVVLAAAASIKDDTTILGQAGTYDFAAEMQSYYTSGRNVQLAEDVDVLNANVDEMIVANTSIVAAFGCNAGTAPSGTNVIVSSQHSTVNSIDVVDLSVTEAP